VSGTRYARARHHYPGEPLLPPHASPRGVVAATQDAYLAEIEAEAARARAEYDLLVLPGVELSYNDLDPLLAAHPFRTRRSVAPGRATLRFARDWRTLRDRLDRWELFNRYDLFGWVAECGLPAVATGDFHRPEHLYGWKTLLPCRKDDASVVDYLRSDRPTFLTRIDPPHELRHAA
jgi:hypothetical protein